ARVVADTRPRADGDGALARSRLQSPAPTLGHRHAQPGRLRGALLGSPRSGLTQVSTRPGQDHLLGSPRLNFHGDRARHGPIDTCGVTGAEVNLNRGAPVEEGLPCHRAENILAVFVVRTHSP